MDAPSSTGIRFVAFAVSITAQVVNTSTMDGTVTDTQGAVVAKAEVSVKNTDTGQTFPAVSDDRGHWAVPSLATATYSVFQPYGKWP